MTCGSRHTKVSSPTPPRWVLDGPVNISRVQWLLKDYVFDPTLTSKCLVGPLQCNRLSVMPSLSPASPGSRSTPGQPSDVLPSVGLLCVAGSIGLLCSRQTYGFRCGAFPPRVPKPPLPALALWRQAHLKRAPCDWNMRSHTLLKDKLLRRDRQLSLERFALRAARAAACSDFRTTFKIVKSFQTTPVCFCAGWNIAHRGRSYQSTLEAASCRGSPFAVPAHSDDVDLGEEWHPSHTDLANILARVDGSKALGSDGISATDQRAGGHVLLQHLHDIVSASISQQRFPMNLCTCVPWYRCIPLYRTSLPHPTLLQHSP